MGGLQIEVNLNSKTAIRVCIGIYLGIIAGIFPSCAVGAFWPVGITVATGGFAGYFGPQIKNWFLSNVLRINVNID